MAEKNNFIRKLLPSTPRSNFHPDQNKFFSAAIFNENRMYGGRIQK